MGSRARRSPKPADQPRLRRSGGDSIGSACSISDARATRCPRRVTTLAFVGPATAGCGTGRAHRSRRIQGLPAARAGRLYGVAHTYALGGHVGAGRVDFMGPLDDLPAVSDGRLVLVGGLVLQLHRDPRQAAKPACQASGFTEGLACWTTRAMRQGSSSPGSRTSWPRWGGIRRSTVL
jgi:hypothetical protein